MGASEPPDEPRRGVPLPEVPRYLPDRLPFADQVRIKRSKVRDYLLNPDDPDGGPKARVFRGVLGYSRNEWETFITELRAAVPHGEVTGFRQTDHGGNWGLLVQLRGPNRRSAPVRTFWHVIQHGTVPSLVTAAVDLRLYRRTQDGEAVLASLRPATARAVAEPLSTTHAGDVWRA